MKAAKVLIRRLSGKDYGSFRSTLNGTSRMSQSSIIWRISGIGVFHDFTDLYMESRCSKFRINHEYEHEHEHEPQQNKTKTTGI